MKLARAEKVETHRGVAKYPFVMGLLTFKLRSPANLGKNRSYPNSQQLPRLPTEPELRQDWQPYRSSTT
jgi:hypothetical protein